MFKKAKQSRVFQDVVEQIQEAILDGRPERQLKPADPARVAHMINAYGNAS